MKQKVHFIHYENYWVAEAENGAVSQGSSLGECRENIKDAISEIERFRKDEMPLKKEEFFDEIEVGL